MYKLLVSDIDATLIDKDFRVPEYNEKMIKRAREAGVEFMLCTGRIYGAARPYAKRLGLSPDIPIITSNGAVTIDWQTGEVVFGTAIDPVLCGEIFNILDEMDIYYHFYCKNTFYTRKFYEGGRFVRLMNESLPPEEKFATLETDDPHGVAKIDPVYKISARLENKVDYDRFMAVFGSRTDIEITSSFKDNYEISAKGVNKGTAVAKYAELKGIRPEEIITFGDNHNDIEMIQYAGVGIAVDNAVEELKAAADYVTDTNENGGVGKAIAKFVFGEE